MFKLIYSIIVISPAAVFLSVTMSFSTFAAQHPTQNANLPVSTILPQSDLLSLTQSRRQKNIIQIADRRERRAKRRAERREKRRESRAKRRAERRRERRIRRERRRDNRRYRYRRDYDDSSPAKEIIGAIGGIIINEALRNERSSEFERCDDRYRSFRYSDGTYQPFGGGPRRLCPYLR